MKQLRKEIAVLTGFYQQQPAYRAASDLGPNYQAITRVYQRLREAIYHVILYNYRGVSKYHSPMYRKEVEYRFNHRKENILRRFLDIYFGYVSG